MSLHEQVKTFTWLLVLLCLAACRTAPAAPEASPPTASSLAIGATAESFDSLFQSVDPTTTAVFVQGDYAYVNLGPVLVILDVSDPQVPMPVGAVKLPVETITDIAVHEGIAYVAALEAGLRIVDVSNPTRPTEVGVYHPPLTGGLAKNYTGSGPEPAVQFYNRQGVNAVAVGQVDGQLYAHVAALGAGLRLVNISDPARPLEVGALTPAEGGIVDLVLANGLTYMVNPQEGLHVVDTSQAARPRISGSDPRGWGFAIAAGSQDSHLLYVAYGSCSSIVNECPGGVHLIDVSDPAAPHTSLGSELPLSFSHKLAVGQQRVYAATLNGLSILNVTDPSHPAAEAYDALLAAQDLTVAGQTLYLAAGAGGLQIFDLSTPAAPVPVSVWPANDGPGQAVNPDQIPEEPTAGFEATSVAAVAPTPTPTPAPSETATPAPGLATGPTSTRSPSSPALPPAGSSPLALVGHIGGISQALTGRGQTLYLGDGTELAILDVSDPARPRRVGYVVLPDVVTAIFVIEDLAYVEVNQNGFQIIDVSNPAAPAIVGDLERPQGALTLTLNGETAYVATNEAGQGLFYSDGQARPVIEWDNLLFLPAENEIKILDVSTAPKAVEVATIDLPGPFQDMVLAGSNAYVVDTAALRVFDISDSTKPAETGFYATSDYMQMIYSNPGMGPGCATSSLVVEGRYAYIDGCDGNQIVDISNSAQPVRAGSFDATAGPMVVSINGYGYVNGPGRVGVIDLSTAPDLKQVGAYRTPASRIGAIVVSGDHAFIANPYHGLLVLDVSKPANPVGVGFFSSPSYGFGLDAAVQDDYVYVLDTTALHILDISQLENPKQLGVIELNASAPYQELSSVAVADDFAYVAGRFNDASLWIVDVSDPAAPAVVSAAYALPHGAQDVTVVDRRAYIVTGDGLEVVDVSDPAAPARLGAYHIPGVLWTRAVVSGNYAYLGAMYPDDLRIVDISDPATIEEVGILPAPGDARAIDVAASFAYVLDEYRRGLRVVDILAPAKPTKAAFYELPNPSQFDIVAVANGLVYAGAGDAGLYILQHTPR